MPKYTVTWLPTWDQSRPALLPRSAFYPLEPIGVGTPYVESLTGYIARLAQAHAVSARRLMTKALQSVASTIKSPVGMSLDPSLNHFSRWINGCRTMAQRWVGALEAHTLRRDLRFLTLLTYAPVLAHSLLLHLHRRWCPACYEEWRTTGHIVYEPLLWAIPIVTLCPRHHRRLLEVCAHCAKAHRAFDRRLRPGYCAECGAWLGSSDPARSLKDRPSKEELRRQTEVITPIGELLAAAPTLEAPPSKNLFTRTILWCLDRFAYGHWTTMDRRIQHKVNLLRDWLNGHRTPTLAQLLRIAQWMEISVLDLLTGTNILSPAERRAALKAFSIPDLRTERQCQQALLRVDIRLALQAALNPFRRPPMVTEIAHQFGYSKASLYRHWPNLCRALAARGRRWKREPYWQVE